MHTALVMLRKIRALGVTCPTSRVSSLVSTTKGTWLGWAAQVLSCSCGTHLILFLMNSTVGTTGLWTSYTPGPMSRL